MIALSDAIEFRLKYLLPELRLELLASLFIQLRSGWLVLLELPPIVRDLFGKGLFDPMELTALEALLELKYSEPLPKKNAKKSRIPEAGDSSDLAVSESLLQIGEANRKCIDV